jgi:hypothetical protein
VPLRSLVARPPAEAIPGARYDVIEGLDHNLAGEAIAPVLAAFVRP